MRAWRAEGAVGSRSFLSEGARNCDAAPQHRDGSGPAVGFRSFLSEGAWKELDAAPQHRDGSGPAGPSSGARDVVLSRAVKAGGGEVDAGDGEGGGDRGLVFIVSTPAEGLAARCDAAGVAKACRELGPRLACWKS